MKNVSAFDYMERLDTQALSVEDRRIADKYFARMEAIDSKLFALKAERRAMADWFLSAIAKQKPKNNNEGDNQGGMKDSDKTLYGMNIKVINT